MHANTITGTYGASHTPTDIYTYRGWYVCHGSVNANRTDPEDLVDLVDVETLSAYDCFTWSEPITSEDMLAEAVES